MRQIDLLQHLVGHEYPASVFSVLGVGTATNEGWVLEALAPAGWRIAYFERGVFAYERETFVEETAACEAYLALVREAQIVVMTTSSRPAAESLQAALAGQGMPCRLHDVPSGVFGTAMTQVVVAAPDCARALRIVCHEPMREPMRESLRESTSDPSPGPR